MIYIVTKKVQQINDYLFIGISEELRSNVLLLLEMIFVRDGSFYVINNDAPFCSRQDLVSFISLICTA